MSPKEILSYDFPDLVKSIGTLHGEYSIKLDENAKGVIHLLQKVAASFERQVVNKLKMDEDGNITPLIKQTEWVSSMVLTLKNDKVHICVDPRELNKHIKCEHSPTRNINDSIPSIPNAKVFFVLGVKSGFMQIRLDKKSFYLTTFKTPLGRYWWLRLTFGIKSAPGNYKRIMDEMLCGINAAMSLLPTFLLLEETKSTTTKH